MRRAATLTMSGLAALSGMFVLTNSATAAIDRVWIGTSGDGDGVSYGNPLNWSPSGVPGLSDGAIFNFVSADVQMPGGLVVNDRLLVSGGDLLISLDIQGGVFRLDSSSAVGMNRSLVVGGAKGEQGFLQLLDGTVMAKHAVIGAAAGSDGDLNVVNSASLQVSGTTVIGESGDGHVDVNGQFLTGPVTLAVEPGSAGFIGTDATTGTLIVLGDMTSGEGGATVDFSGGALALVFGNLSLSTSAGGEASLVLANLGTTFLVDEDLTLGGGPESAGGLASMELKNNAVARAGGALRAWPGGAAQIESRLDAMALDVRGGIVNIDKGATIVLGSLGADPGPGLFAGLEESSDITTIDVADGGQVGTPLAELGSAPGSRTATTVAGANSFLNVAGDLHLGWDPVDHPPTGAKAQLAAMGGAGLGVGGTLLVRQGGVLSVDGATVFTGQLTITDHGLLDGVVLGNAPTTLVDAGSASVGGGLFLRQQDGGFLPGLGTIYNAVRTLPGGDIEGAFAVILARPLPAFRYYRFDAPQSKDGAGKGSAFVSLEIDKLESILGLTEVVPVPLDGSPNKIIAGPFDGNGMVDAFVTIPGDRDEPGEGALLLNDNGGGKDAAGGGFKVAATIPIGADPSGLASGDFTDDGQPDFVVSNADDGTIQVIFNSSTGLVGGLSQGPILQVGGRPRSVMVADFNNDLRPDLVWVDPTTNEVKTADGEGGGKFGEPEAATAGPQPASVCPLDLDNDKDVDVVVVNAGAGAAFKGTPQGSSVSIHLNRFMSGGTGFEKAVFYPVGDGAIALAEADLNGDGLIDMATANSIAGTISVLIGKPDGTFLPAVDLPAGGFPTDIAAGDFDNDEAKDIDLAVLVTSAEGAPGLTIFRNDSFAGQCVLTILENAQDLIGLPQAITSADTDGDGPSDLVFVGSFDESGGGGGYVSVLVADPIFCPADADGNGAVDGNDLGGVLSAYGPAPEGSIYDVNKDGVIDGIDLSIVLSGWGACDLGNQ